MSKNKIKAGRLSTIIYREIFDIIDDETGHPSYRMYLDKVVEDIFEIEDVGTGFMMAANQFKFIKRLINDPESKALCQLLLRNEDVKALHQLVRVAYDIAQIANKSKKKITTKDIKSYRYLTDLYTKSVKKLRKKYKIDYCESKKAYQNKYSELDKLAGGGKVKTPYYEFSDNDYFEDDDNESLEAYIDEDEDEYDDEIGFDITDLPTKFVVKDSSKKSKKNHLVLDGDNEKVELYDEEEDDDDDEEEDGVMPQAQFQKYTLSLFEILIDRINNPQRTDNEPNHTLIIDHSDDMDPGFYQPIPSVDYIGDPYPVESTGTVITEPTPPEVSTSETTKLESDSTSNAQIFNEKKDYGEMTTPELITEFNNSQTAISASSKDNDPNIETTLQNSEE